MQKLLEMFFSYSLDCCSWLQPQDIQDTMVEMKSPFNLSQNSLPLGTDDTGF